LIEGFKQGDFPKLEVWRAEIDKAPLWPSLPSIEAIATDSSINISGKPVLALSDVSGIADFIYQNAAESDVILSTEGRNPHEKSSSA
jgi:molybdopterin-guanine dinucleotide biosynthesis adapter protein